jgi:hypothetical protein
VEGPIEHVFEITILQNPAEFPSIQSRPKMGQLIFAEDMSLADGIVTGNSR